MGVWVRANSFLFVLLSECGNHITIRFGSRVQSIRVSETTRYVRVSEATRYHLGKLVFMPHEKLRETNLGYLGFMPAIKAQRKGGKKKTLASSSSCRRRAIKLQRKRTKKKKNLGNLVFVPATRDHCTFKAQVLILQRFHAFAFLMARLPPTVCLPLCMCVFCECVCMCVCVCVCVCVVC